MIIHFTCFQKTTLKKTATVETCTKWDKNQNSLSFAWTAQLLKM